jgi:hypothetical protein
MSPLPFESRRSLTLLVLQIRSWLLTVDPNWLNVVQVQVRAEQV